MSERLKTGAKQIGIVLSDAQFERLSNMLDILALWNEKHNLTRLTKRDDQEIYHVLDALAAFRYFEPYGTIVDIGTGAGFPGIPLAIAYPDKQFHLVDSNGKKVAYLRQLVSKLGLTNVRLYHERAERLDIAGVDVITARAVSDPEDIMQLTKHLGDNVQYVLYVGPGCPKVSGATIESIEVPGSTKQHFILTI